jgi:hypothetical protein
MVSNIVSYYRKSIQHYRETCSRHTSECKPLSNFTNEYKNGTSASRNAQLSIILKRNKPFRNVIIYDNSVCGINKSRKRTATNSGSQVFTSVFPVTLSPSLASIFVYFVCKAIYTSSAKSTYSHVLISLVFSRIFQTLITLEIELFHRNIRFKNVVYVAKFDMQLI